MSNISEMTKSKILDACKKIINDEVDFIEGCRDLVSLRDEYDLHGEELFYPIVGVVSETDDYPSKDIQSNFNKDYMERLNQEVASYVSKVKSSTIEDCRKLILKYEQC